MDRLGFHFSESLSNFSFEISGGSRFTFFKLFIMARSPTGKISAWCRAMIRYTSTVQFPIPFIFFNSSRMKFVSLPFSFFRTIFFERMVWISVSKFGFRYQNGGYPNFRIIFRRSLSRLERLSHILQKFFGWNVFIIGSEIFISGIEILVVSQDILSLDLGNRC